MERKALDHLQIKALEGTTAQTSQALEKTVWNGAGTKFKQDGNAVDCYDLQGFIASSTAKSQLIGRESFSTKDADL